MKIIDTHQHLWDLEKFSYEWTARADVLNRSYRLSDYQAATVGLEVDKTVFLECDVDAPFRVAEARYLCELSENPDNKIAGVVAACRPEESDFEEYLKSIAHPNLKGVRRILHVVSDDTVDLPGFIANVQKLPKYNLSFDICVLARQLPIAIRLVKECPEVQFILDHCANPRINEKEISPWQDLIAELASYPNVAGKISGIVTNAAPNTWNAEDLRPYVNHMITSFGWERVMFGSDWPVCLQNATYQKWAEALLALTATADIANQSKLFQTNAERIYRL